MTLGNITKPERSKYQRYTPSRQSLSALACCCPEPAMNWVDLVDFDSPATTALGWSRAPGDFPQDSGHSAK